MSESTRKLHRRGILIPLEEKYSAANTISVLRMNRAELDYDFHAGRPVLPNPEVVPERFKQLLHDRGYSRLYVLFLFSLAGDLSRVSNPNMADLVRSGTDELYQDIFRDSAKVVMAYGKAPSPNLEPLVYERVQRIQEMVAAHCSDPQLYQFGACTSEGVPREPEEVTESDEICVMINPDNCD